jgi:hypothetical protein
MQRHTLIQNAGATIILCTTVFIVLKVLMMSRYHLPGKIKLFLYSLKNISKPQISGIEHIGMRSYMRRSNIVNKFFYLATATIVIFYIVVNSALRQ